VLPAALFAVLTSLVDTFVGTSGTPVGGPIDTFPGADLPFGMVQWSPDTPSQNAGGGYEYSDREITGFSLTHLSGPGCNVFGDFAVLPSVGAIPSDPSSLRQPFTHATEVGAPGWYAVSLGAPAIRAELSVTQRTGLGRFTFPATTQANLLFNAASNQAGVTNAHVEIDGNDELSGSASSGFFCGMPDRYTVYFAARFDRPFRESGTYASGRGAWISFDTTHRSDVVVKVALSFVSLAGARANLAAEAKSWNVVDVRNRATETWSAMLRRISVAGGTPAEQRTFYTALYHVLLHPNLISDVTGDYMGFDGRIHHARPGHNEYANFSDWDIYRTEVPLLGLLAPQETSDMMQSLVDAAAQDGWLPRWALVNGPTSVMGGDSMDPVIAGAYAFGARDFDTRAALAAMVKGASTTTAPPGQGWYVERWELDDDYLRRGYVVNTHTTSVSPGPNGASETLEYAYDDFSIARLASALRNTSVYERFMRRSANWMTLFDATRSSIEPRDSDGAFMHAPITENGESGFQEGNAAQYTWMIPHDLRDLIAAMGGTQAARTKLDTFFSQLNAGQDKPYAWLGNEPSLGSPWVYLSAGAPWRAQEIVRRALTTLYADTPDGLPGNDDLGTMSAWYVWSAIGLYPQNPAARYLDVGAPLFTSVTLRAPGSPAIVLSSPRSSDANGYVARLTINGRPRDAAWFELPLRGTVRLDVAVSDRPNMQWGAGAGAAPPSFATLPLSTPPSCATVFETATASLPMSAGTTASFDFSIVNTASTPEGVTWRATAPPGLELGDRDGNVAVPPNARANVTTRISAAATLPAGYYRVRIDGRARNGALLERLIVPVRIGNGSQRPRIAYAQNRFGNTITPIDLSTGFTGPEIVVGEEPRDAVLSADGTRLYVANLAGNSISVVGTEQLKTIATVKTGSGPNGLALEPGGRTLWVANSGDATVQPIDTASLIPGTPVAVGPNPKAIAIASDGTLYVSNNGSNTVSRVDLRTRRVTATFSVGSKPSGLALTPDGKRLYVVDSADNDVMALDLGGQAIAARIPTGVYPVQIAIAPSGRIAYVTNYANAYVTPIDLTTQTAKAPIGVGGAPYGVAIASDGRTAIVVSHRDDNCVLIDLESGRVSKPIPLGIGPYTVAAP
jgi:predicted alpha-1,2-mannosidase